MKKNKEVILYVVVPCYNEELVLLETTKKLKKKLQNLINLKKISKKSRVLYVNDGSSDKTWDLIKNIASKETLFNGICLSRNYGHQNALVAGLLTAKKYSDIVISMDADLQDDIEVMDEMIEKYNNDCDIVYGVRKSRKKDNWFKKTSAEIFYKFLKFIGVDIVFNHADYRLTSKKVLDSFEDFKEVNLFLRGIFPIIGYNSDVVYYERKERFAGKSKYSLKKMFNFALDGITSFSIKPIRLIFYFGVVMFLLSLSAILYSIIIKLFGKSIDSWYFIICSMWLIASVQLLSLGIVGEYIAKIYNETKRRPRYIIREELIDEKEKN